ncbi:MAG TPA: nitroreductase family protein [Actinomycetota bacterium]|nr:nitroreductase family protein [Actinomycetota bacterium]
MGQDMPLREAMETQRAIRKLKPDPVPDDVLLRCIELALKAPTGSNSQNWEWIVVRDREVKAKLARLYRPAWRIYGGVGRMVVRRNEKMRRNIDAVQWQVDHFEEMPVLVVPCIRGPRFNLFPIAATSHYGSIYPAIQNFLLACRAHDLGAALTTLPLWSMTAARRALGLPFSVQPVAVIPVGWPRGRYGPTSRKPVEKVVHYDRWGNRRPSS